MQNIFQLYNFLRKSISYISTYMLHIYFSIWKGLYALCSTVIRKVRIAGNMNSTESKFKKMRKKRCTLYLVLSLSPLYDQPRYFYYPFLPSRTSRD